MPLEITHDAPTMLIRREAYERAGLVRAQIDAWLGLTPDEFRVEGGLIAIGPLYGDDAIGELAGKLEELGLVQYDDFFDLSGNWPAWLRLFAMATAAATTTERPSPPA
ncbi:MAG TPA: hypothetical protein VFS05_00720 [Gemmatimonadaceae bacterium]|nr:hypothetical protein [Gemmatimonadaceae bacterium]